VGVQVPLRAPNKPLQIKLDSIDTKATEVAFSVGAILVPIVYAAAPGTEMPRIAVLEVCGASCIGWRAVAETPEVRDEVQDVPAFDLLQGLLVADRGEDLSV
jgi:hypothetical protein